MSKSTTNKLLILNSILLVLILVLLLILNYDVLIKKIVHNPDEDYAIYNMDEEVKFYPKQDSLEIDADGLKNDTILLPEKIIETIASELKGFNWNEEFQTEDLHSIYHQTIFAQQFPTEKGSFKKFIIITFTNYGGNYSHVAYGRISLFEFWKESQNWEMTRNYLAFGDSDEYGLEPTGCELVRIGKNNKYAVIVPTSYSGNGGHDKQSQSVYAEVDNSFELVFDFTNYEYYFDYPKDIDYTDGNSEMRIIDNGKEWFDIETKPDFAEWDEGEENGVRKFVFEEDQYIKKK